jgi:putative membrane protein
MKHIAGRILGVLSGVSTPVAACAQERRSDFWGMHSMWGMWGAWGTGMMFMMLVFWGLVIVGLVLGLRWLLTQGRESRSDTTLDILRQRYARGEIDREEFEARRRDLSYIEPHDIGTPAFAVAGNISPSPRCQRGAREARGDLSQQILYTIHVWCDLEHGREG